MYLSVVFVTLGCSQKGDWQTPFTFHSIIWPVVAYDHKYLSQQPDTATLGIRMPYLGASATEACTPWGEWLIIPSNNTRASLPQAVMVDRGFLSFITYLGASQLLRFLATRDLLIYNGLKSLPPSLPGYLLMLQPYQLFWLLATQQKQHFSQLHIKPLNEYDSKGLSSKCRKANRFVWSLGPQPYFTSRW